MMVRPKTTLFLLMSVDGKISTGDTDLLDFDRDLPYIAGVREGLSQYYDLEQETDLFSFNTGRVMTKIGVNEKTDELNPIPVTYVIVDNKPHLTTASVEYLAKKTKKLIIITTNSDHPAYQSSRENVVIISRSAPLIFRDVFEELYRDHHVEALTIQSGGTLNAELFREGLIDFLSIVVAPMVVGGSTTPTMVDGEANHVLDDLKSLTVLKLIEAKPLEHSYLHLKYEVANAQKFDKI